MGLRDKYNHAIQTAKSLRMDGSAEERQGKLHFRGTVRTQDEVNTIWDAIKTVPSWQQEIAADIRATAPRAQTGSGRGGEQGGGTGASADQSVYTVRSGDTLSRIAQEQLGDAGAYMRIFEANRDQLSDPDRIQPGQVLKIPQRQAH